jgi:hypothetical protein
MGEIMKVRTSAMSAAIMLALSGTPTSPAQAQQPDQQVAECVRGDWESTQVTVVQPATDAFKIGGGDGVSLMIEPDGAATADFSDMGRVTFSGEAHDTTVRGFMQFGGEVTGTVSTTADTENSGTMHVADVDAKDVKVTATLTEPFKLRVSQVPVDQLRQLAQKRGHTHAPVVSETSYQCGPDTLTLTSTVQDQRPSERQATLTWSFQRPTK